jgi:hypothetical protein
MNFWRISFVFCIIVVILASLFTIFSIFYAVKIFNFVSVSCATNFVLVCAVASSSSTLSSLSYHGYNSHVIFCCSSFSCSTTRYSFMLARSVVIVLVGGRVFVRSYLESHVPSQTLFSHPSLVSLGCFSSLSTCMCLCHIYL